MTQNFECSPQVCKDQSLGQSTIHRWLAQYDAEVRGERVTGAPPQQGGFAHRDADSPTTQYLRKPQQSIAAASFASLLLYPCSDYSDSSLFEYTKG